MGTITDRDTLAIVLHSHMPYVEGFGTWPFGEEWLFEAMATVYLPLVELAEGWAAEGRENVLTLGLTPVLCDQLELPQVNDRLCTFLREVRLKHFHEDASAFRRGGQAALGEALDDLSSDYRHALGWFEAADGDLLTRFDRLASAGVVGLWTSAATHAVLPLVATEAGRRLQIKTGVTSHRRRFSAWEGGFWLPECAYEDGLTGLLTEAGATAFCVDQSHRFGRLDMLEPVQTAAGPLAVPVDWPTVQLVWGDGGYPAHPDYRDYHAHTVNGLRPYRNSGLPYERSVGADLAGQHADDFLAKVAKLLETYRKERGRPGLVTCALDTELLGHWWLEGPIWLRAVVERAERFGIELTTLPKGLTAFDPVERTLRPSSWGSNKDLSTWDGPRTAELVWRLRSGELGLLRSVSQLLRAGYGAAELEQSGPLMRACRELLALQSSDWAFMVERGLAADYPIERSKQHWEALQSAIAALASRSSGGNSIEPKLRGLAPDLSLGSLYGPPSATLA